MFYGLTLVLCVVLRLLPHPFNLAPVGAGAVFAGRTLRLPWAIALTWVGMFIANIALAKQKGYPVVDPVTPFVFVAFGIQVWLGHAWRGTRWGAFPAAACGAVTFFLLSNLGTFLMTPLYPRTAAGLEACFVAALPFLKGTLAGDLLWTAALLPLYRWVERRSEGAELAPVSSAA